MPFITYFQADFRVACLYRRLIALEPYFVSKHTHLTFPYGSDKWMTQRDKNRLRTSKIKRRTYDSISSNTEAMNKVEKSLKRAYRNNQLHQAHRMEGNRPSKQILKYQPTRRHGALLNDLRDSVHAETETGQANGPTS